MVVTTAALHNHFYWFLCLDPEAAEYVPVENLFIFGIFTDGFPLFKGIAATLSCLVLANLPAMLQMPDFHFLNFFVKDGESSPSTWFLIRNVESEATELEESGITLDFTGYSNSMCLPKSNKKLNGRHHFRLKFFGKGDSKMKLQLNGSQSANMRYPAPEINWSVEQQGNPAYRLHCDMLRTFEEKMESFLAMESKKAELDVSFNKSKAALMENKKLGNKEINKRLEKLQSKYRKDLNTHAAKLRTCIIHWKPVRYGHWFPPCLLHFSCNEWARFLNSCEGYASHVTMQTGAHNGKAIYRKLGGSFEPIPNLEHCKSNAPTVKFIRALIHLVLAPRQRFYF